MAPARPTAIEASHEAGPLMFRNTSPGTSILATTPAMRPSSTAPSMTTLLPGGSLRRRIEHLGSGRCKPGGVGQPLVHGPTGLALLGPVAAGHQRVHLAPVAGGQPGGGRLGPRQPGGAGVALDGRALGPHLPQPPRQVHGLVGEDVPGHHLVAPGPALVRAQVGGQVAALVALDQGPRLGAAVGPAQPPAGPDRDRAQAGVTANQVSTAAPPGGAQPLVLGAIGSFGAGVRSAAQDPVHHLEQLLDLLLAAAGGDLVADAAADVAVQQPQGDLVEGGLDGRDLGDDVDAVLVLVDHAGHAADLALDAAQPGLELLLVHAVAGPRRLPSFSRPYRGSVS